MSQPIKRVLWAFDPYTDISETWKRSKEAVTALQKGEGVQVEPVYVMGADQLDWVGHLEAPQLAKIKPYVQKAMDSRIKQLEMDLLPSVILENGENSRKADIDLLLSHAKSTGADVLLINTHAREGVKRFFMGSFAETLALKSNIPVLFVTPNSHAIESLNKVVFPTNFSAESFDVFRSFLEQYSGIVKEVVIHNKILRPINAFAESSITAMGGSWIAPEEYLTQEAQRREELAQDWVNAAEGLGVKATIEVDEELGDVSDSIEETCKKTKADMVVVGSFASALEAALIGSIARQVVRQADIPAMVFHKDS